VSKKKYIPVIIAAFIWIWPSILIKFLSPYFDGHTQNFYRYLAAVVVLVPLNLACYREEFLHSLKNIRQFLLPVFLVFIFQTLWVKGIYLLEPALVALIARSSVLFVAFFSFIFFADERQVIHSRVFIIGSLMAIAGVAGVIAGKNGLRLGSLGPGVLIILLGAVFWALYLTVVKKIVRNIDTLVAVTIIFSLAVPLFLAASLLFGNIGDVMKTPAGVNVVLFVSGIFCVGIANAFNYKSIKLIGTSISSNFVLITPFFTAVASYFIFGEVLSSLQVVSGIVLVAGCVVLLRTANLTYRKAQR
jgi:drug/metabolite transporter (DMT)-like permease